MSMVSYAAGLLVAVAALVVLLYLFPVGDARLLCLNTLEGRICETR